MTTARLRARLHRGWLHRGRLHRGWRVRLAVVAGLLGFVVGVYVVVVLAGGALIGRTDSPSLPLSVLATLIVALLFARVQATLEGVVARALGRSTATPYEVLSRFSQAVTGGDAGDGLPRRMAGLLGEGTGALWTQVWLVIGGRLTLAGNWPESADTDLRAPPVPPVGDAVDEAGRRSLQVGHAGQLLGVLRLQERSAVALTSVEQRLFTGLAAQAGLVLRRVGLQAALEERHDQLVAHAGELRTSRQRLIDTQDGERRRLERDMHDGAQQHLVALAVNLRLAQTVAAQSPERAARLLAAQATAAVQTIATLTSLSRGIYPRLLTDDGLMVALRSAATASATPVSVHPAPPAQVGRLPAPVEAALYFCALEAMQNASKHAGADHVTLTLRQEQDCWTLSVVDDGTGFDRQPASGKASAGGLLNMADRLSAVGGSVDVTSRSGSGTTVTARVPRAQHPGPGPTGPVLQPVGWT